MSYLGDEPPQSRQFCTTRGDWLSLGIKAALIPWPLYPFKLTLYLSSYSAMTPGGPMLVGPSFFFSKIILMMIHFRKWIREIKDEGKQHTCQFGWSELAASLLESFLFSPSTSGKKKLSAWTWIGTNLYYNSIMQRSYTNFLRHLGLFWYNPVVSILVITDLK